MEKWRSQLKMALVAKTNIEPDHYLRDKPTTVIYTPGPVEEQPVNRPTQTMVRQRETHKIPPGRSQMEERLYLNRPNWDAVWAQAMRQC